MYKNKILLYVSVMFQCMAGAHCTHIFIKLIYFLRLSWIRCSICSLASTLKSMALYNVISTLLSALLFGAFY